MNTTPAFEKKHMIADCPNCRNNQLYSMKVQKSSFGFSTDDELLVCRNCRLAIFVKELKQVLLSV
jgi:uncharacterized protein YbaR (Trm112 family)